MGRKSTVAFLDAAIVDEVNKLVRGGKTIDDIVNVLRELGASVSRSAVGRYVQSARESMEKYRQAQEVAKVWVDKLETEPQGDVARLLPEMLRAVAFQSISQIGESDEGIDPQGLMFLAKALKDLSGATKGNLEIELKLREMRARAKAAAEEVGQIGKKSGWSEETINTLKAKFLGITDGPAKLA